MIQTRMARSLVVGLLFLTSCAAADARTAVVAAALWSAQDVFLSEASQAARLVAARYGHGGPVVVLDNSRRRLGAGPDAMAQAIRNAERRLDPDRDVLFILLTSHGSPEGIAEQGGGVEGTLSPEHLGNLLATFRTKQKVLVVSACFAGIFTGLASPDTLVITAADATHPSFGCQEGAKWTYFGDAFFNQALRHAAPREPLTEVFSEAARLVKLRESGQGFEPSNPQIAGGDHVLATLRDMP